MFSNKMTWDANVKRFKNKKHEEFTNKINREAMKRKNSKGDVEWFLTSKSKRPFAYSTKAESDAISCIIEECGDLREVIKRGYILSPNEKYIINRYISEGIYRPVLSKPKVSQKEN